MAENPNYTTGQKKPTEAVNPGPIQQKPTAAEEINQAMQQPAPVAPQSQTPAQQINQAMQQQVTPVATKNTQIRTGGQPKPNAVPAPSNTPHSQQAAANARMTQEATGNLYRVGANGQFPQGLKVGDRVATAQGTYTIMGVNADGTYQSKLTDATQTTGTLPGFAKPYADNVDYAAEIQKAVQAGDLGAAAVLEDLRNQKIMALGLQGQTPTTSIYAQYLGQVLPNYQAQLINGYAPDKTSPVNTSRSLLEQWRATAAEQAQRKADYATQKGINELQRAQEDAQPEFQKQLDQNDIDTARALSNSALYAEARGDRGGIGQSQFNEIQAAALKNRQSINNARTKLATDTARQIADLRAQGEFEAADQLLTISQQYLTKAMELEQWNAQYMMSQEEMARELEQWQKQFDLQVANVTGYYNGQLTRSAANDERDRVAAVGESLLKVGVMPSDEQLAAIGMTKDQAQAYIWALGMGFSGGGSTGGGGGGSSRGTGSGGNGEPAPVVMPTGVAGLNGLILGAGLGLNGNGSGAGSGSSSGKISASQNLADAQNGSKRVNPTRPYAQYQ